MKIGLHKTDITPRVGVELQGYGPFLNRHSDGVYDPLFARAMAVEVKGERALLVSCDLIGVTRDLCDEARKLVHHETGIPASHILIHAIHTHSGPSTRVYSGWGTPDPPYLEILPRRIAQACLQALGKMKDAVLSHAEVPCEGLAINREYDAFQGASIDEVLKDGWRPAKPETTDTTCHVLTITARGKLTGFLSYYGCHPVIGGWGTHKIHGDYAGVATNRIERRHPGSVGLFLQGAQGDINSALVCGGEPEALRALDVLADRYARAVENGMKQTRPVTVDSLVARRLPVTFSRKPWGPRKLQALLAEQESILHAPDATDADSKLRLAMVRATALRRMLAQLKAGESLEPRSAIQGLRLGPVSFLGSPFEVFRAIKNEVLDAAVSPIPLVMGFTGDSLGYAVDKTKAAAGGYAADLVPLICGALPFARIHEELVAALLKLDRSLNP
jgi:hypothetical protein